MELSNGLSASAVKEISSLFLDLYARMHALQKVLINSDVDLAALQEETFRQRERLQSLPAVVELRRHADVRQLEAVARNLPSTSPG